MHFSQRPAKATSRPCSRSLDPDVVLRGDAAAIATGGPASVRRWTRTLRIPTGGLGLTSVSCWEAGQCMIGGANGEIYAYAGRAADRVRSHRSQPADPRLVLPDRSLLRRRDLGRLWRRQNLVTPSRGLPETQR